MPSNSERARIQQKAWRVANAEHVRQRRKERHLAHREADNNQSQAYKSAHLEQVTEQTRNWRAAHPERVQQYRDSWREKFPELDAEIKAAWKKRNPQRIILQNHRRRARVANATIVAIDEIQLLAKWEYWSGRCWMCRRVAVEWDHVKPIAMGGLHCLANLRPACRPCNAKKGAKWPYKISHLVSGAAGAKA